MITIESNVQFNSHLRMKILVISSEDVQQHGLQPGDRFHAEANGEKWRCGLVSYGDGSLYIMLNKNRAANAGIEKDSIITLSLEEDNSEYGMEMPEELRALLEDDSEFDKRFHAQTKGFQRTFIYYVANYKSEEKRLEHATRMMRNIMSFPTDKVKIGPVVNGKL